MPLDAAKVFLCPRGALAIEELLGAGDVPLFPETIGVVDVGDVQSLTESVQGQMESLIGASDLVALLPRFLPGLVSLPFAVPRVVALTRSFFLRNIMDLFIFLLLVKKAENSLMLE